MSRRNQSHRRRTYGRRQHEVRERRPDSQPAEGWLAEPELDTNNDWRSADNPEEHVAFGDPYGGFAQ